MKSFITKISIAAAVLVLFGGVVFGIFIPGYYLSIMPVTLVFFWLVTILVHAYQLRLAKKDMGKFTRNNMLITFFKLVVYSVFTIVYIALYSENALPFVICVIIIYLVFSVLEVADVTKTSKKKL